MLRLAALALCLAVPTTGTACPTAKIGAGCGNAFGQGGVKRIKVQRTTPLYAPGQLLPDHYMVLLNTRYYGLPPVGADWLYLHGDREIYRANRVTRVVIERVTHRAGRAYR